MIPAAAAAAAIEISQQKLYYKETQVGVEIVLGFLDVLIKKSKNELGRWSPATPAPRKIVKWTF